jgi:nitrite reductase/ring-hydroxylating ferredoxin subunit
MMANLSAVALFGAARIGRRDSSRGPSAWRLLAELAGAGLLGAGGWLGGTLVTRNQISVDHRYANAGKWRVERLPEERLQGRRLEVSVSDLEPDQMKLVLVGDRRIVVARTGDGCVAFDDRCTHKGGPLSDGALACGIVQCPWHGSQFDVQTGEVRRGPALAPIDTYEVLQPAITTRDRPGELAGQRS